VTIVPPARAPVTHVAVAWDTLEPTSTAGEAPHTVAPLATNFTVPPARDPDVALTVTVRTLTGELDRLTVAPAVRSLVGAPFWLVTVEMGSVTDVTPVIADSATMFVFDGV
jgi:hypothetical protein